MRLNLRMAWRGALAVLLAALIALVVRLRGTGGTPPHRGGWKQLSVTDLEPMEEP
jgi:hypothetical protein